MCDGQTCEEQTCVTDRSTKFVCDGQTDHMFTGQTALLYDGHADFMFDGQTDLSCDGPTNFMFDDRQISCVKDSSILCDEQTDFL